MITGNEVFKDLKSLKKKTEFLKNTYSKNEIWEEVDSKLKKVIQTIKLDKRIYQW